MDYIDINAYNVYLGFKYIPHYMGNHKQPTNPKTLTTPHEEKKQADLFSADRLKAIADGVFAVAMTLLVLELVVPEIKEISNKELARILFSMWPKFLAYVLSFPIAGIYWLIHHNIFNSIRYYLRASGSGHNHINMDWQIRARIYISCF